MAYKPVQYDFFNPMEELVPLVNMYNKAYLALDSRLNEYIDWLSSSSELLNRDEQAMELKRKYENDLNTMADALAVGDLRTAHSVNPRTYLYPLKVKQKLAEQLSKNILEQTQRSPLYIFTRRFSVDTPLDEVALDSSYDMIPISKFEEIGKAIGTQLNDTNPEVVGHIMNGATALIQQGVPLEEVMDEVAKNSPLSLAILNEVDNANLVDEYEKYRVRRAVTHGIFLGVGTKTTTMHDSSYRTPAEIRAERKQAREDEEDEAIRYYRRTGDYSRLQNLGLAREYTNSEGKLVVEIGNHNYVVEYLDSSKQDEMRRIAIANNPELAKEENASKLDKAVSDMIQLIRNGKTIKVAGRPTRDSQEPSDRKIKNEVLKTIKEDIENKYGKGYEVVHSPNLELYYAYKEEKKTADSKKPTKKFYVVRRGEHGETLGIFYPDKIELINALMDMYYSEDEIVNTVANSCWEKDKSLKKYEGQDPKNALKQYKVDIRDNYVKPIMNGEEPISIEDDALDKNEEESSETDTADTTTEEGNKFNRESTRRGRGKK